MLLIFLLGNYEIKNIKQQILNNKYSNQSLPYWPNKGERETKGTLQTGHSFEALVGQLES